MPHHRLQTQFRRRKKQLRQPVEQPGRGLPGVPWPGVEPRGVGGEKGDLLHAGFALDLKDKDATVEIETCARCHARRAPLGTAIPSASA
ncbi:hypothetical protein DdX_21630 [Ditylenchus destructor]|uniref:Uncharacterized protein n=1 Tax=Ditylenchus destructor TaxID=166010 RepID=A0AAD4MEM0_9BILA|nr:hypothetical protein DdX_21630 [Ditylenchus destructor]